MQILYPNLYPSLYTSPNVTSHIYIISSTLMEELNRVNLINH